jgi:hypothetical protein
LERLVWSPLNFDGYYWHLKEVFPPIYIHRHFFDAEIYRKCSRIIKNFETFQAADVYFKFIRFERSTCTRILIVLC